jgi:hypothetical protein
MLFVHNDKANLVTQRTERNTCADNEMRSWLKETVVCIEPLTSTQARMDWFRHTTSRGEHVCSNRHLRRLWHEPEHRSTSSDHPYRRFGCCATLPRARWAVDKDGLSRRTAITGRIGDLTLHVSQTDLGPCRVSRCAPSVGMSALNTSHLKLHSASIGESTRRCEAPGERARGDPRIIATRRCRELLHCGNLSTAETHCLQDRRSSIGDQRSEGGVEALCTATHQ